MAAGPQATPGKWEVTTSMNMQGPQGNMKMPAMTNTMCLKPEDAANVQKQYMTGPHGPGKDCKVLDQTTSGDSVKFHVKCEGQAPSEAIGQVSYAGDSYKGHVDVTVTGPQGAMHMSTDFTGKRVGGC